MAELMDHVQMLADQIGPRPVSTEEERQASMYIAQELTDLGLEVDVDEFATPTGVRWPYVIAFAAMVAGTLVSGFGMFIEALSTPALIVGLVLVVAGFFIYYTERFNRPILSKRRADGVSQNIVARYVPSSVARERHRRKVIIMAHVDTVRAEPQANPSIIGRLALLRTMLYFVMIGLVVVYIVRLLPLPWPDIVDLVLWIISLVACVYVLAALGMIVANRFMPYVVGGNDNASSAAAMLSVAKRLLDPAERERYARDQLAEQAPAPEVPVETLAPQHTGSFSPVGEAGEDFAEPVVHDEAAAYEAGVVPEGASIEYAVSDEYHEAEETYPAPWGAPDPESTMAMEPVDAAAGGAAAEGGAAPEGVGDDAVLRERGPVSVHNSAGHETPADEQELASVHTAESARDARASQDVARSAAVPGAGSGDEYHEGDAIEAWRARRAAAKAAEAAAAEQVAAKAGEQAPAPEPDASQERSSVPSWYAAARKKAAQASERKDAGEDVSRYRSRYAEVRRREEPVRTEPEPQPEPQPEPEPQRLDESAASASAAADVQQVRTPAATQPTSESSTRTETPAFGQPAAHDQAASAGAGQVGDPSALSFDIDDEDLDELDASGAFAPVRDESAAGAVPAQDMPVAQSLTTRIPSIGTSVSRDAAPQRRADPRTSGTDAPASKQKAPARKPTARRVDESFQPTKGSDAREEAALSRSKQAAPVSSSYEKTPQAAPKKRSFEQREPQPAATSAQRQEPAVSSQPASDAARSGAMPRIRSGASAADARAVRSQPTSSFPALTGSFPALTGSMPAVSAGDAFSPSAPDPYVPEPDDFAAPAPSMTGTIDIPESRFHNAVEQATGFLGKFGRKKKDADYVDTAWDDEDGDLGWKGGGYLADDGAGVAARRRAAEIRESVISMTENDLLDKEVWFVALGASNAGNQGMKNFLELHSGDLRGSLIINLEAVGAGDICYVTDEGTGKAVRSDRRLQTLVKKASKEVAGKEMKGKGLAWRNTDATPAMLSGLRAISIMGFDGAAPQGWHWSTDTADIVEAEKLDYVARVLMKVIENS